MKKLLVLLVVLAASIGILIPAAGAQDPNPDTKSEAPPPRRSDAPPRGIDLNPPPVAAGDARTIPASVPSDCSKDVTVQMRAFMAAGGPMKLAPNACYVVNEKMVITAGLLDGQDATFRMNRPSLAKCNQHQGFLELKGNGGVKNIKLVREGPGGYSSCHYAEHGIEIRGAANTTVENVRMTNVWGDCIYFQGAQGSLVKNLRCDSNGRQGGAAAKARNVLIDGFVVSKSSRSGFDFEANGTSPDDGIYNFVIDHSDISSNLIAFPSQGYNAPQDAITIRNSVIRKALSAIYDRQVNPSKDSCRGSVQRKNWVVENVTVDPAVNGAGYGGKGLMVFCGTFNVRVSGVTMPGGEVVMEGSSGRLLVENSCVKGVRGVAQTVPIQQVNVKAPPCSGTPPPSSTTTTTTRPPPSSTTTTTTRPPPTVPPTVPPTGDVVWSRAACSAARAKLAQERRLLEAIVPRPRDAIHLQDAVHDELVALGC